MTKKYNASKKALSYRQNIKSWNNGQKRKIVNEPTKVSSTPMRNGLIFT